MGHESGMKSPQGAMWTYIPHQQPRQQIYHVGKIVRQCKQNQSMEPKSYFGHNRSTLSQIGMKLPGFVRGKE
jgi:hypothetical protein